MTNNINGYGTTLIADKYSWVTNNPATNYSGNYTMVVPPALTNTNGPSGYGYASVIINTNGLITMKGLTADGQKLAQKIKLSPSGEWPLFAQNSVDTSGVSPITFLPNKLLKGSVVGWLQVLENTDGAPGRVTGAVKWIRTLNTTALNYTSGFTNVSEVLANRFFVGKDPGTLKYTNSVITAAGGPLTLKISDGNLPYSTNLAGNELTNATMVLDLALLSTKPPLQAKVTLSGKDGLVKGSFFTYPTPGLTPLKFNGIALQAESKAYGFFNNGDQSGKIVIENP
jgi:hypothetical protein